MNDYRIDHPFGEPNQRQRSDADELELAPRPPLCIACYDHHAPGEACTPRVQT